MKDPVKKELIEGITELFNRYEEEYVPGEWEAFSQSGKAKRRLFPIWMKAAAVFFVICSALPFLLKDSLPKDENLAVITNGTKKSGAGSTKARVNGSTQNKVNSTDLASSSRDFSQKEHTAANKNEVAAVKSNVVVSKGDMLVLKERYAATPIKKQQVTPLQNGNTIYIKESPVKVVQETTVAGIGNQGHERGNEMKQDSVGRVGADAVRVAQNQPETQQSTIDFLLSESKTIASATHKTSVTNKKGKGKPDKWDFGIEVMPTVMKSNVNVGAGLITAYKLSDKFSLSSGISLLQLEAGASIPSSASNSSFANRLSTKELTAIDANLRAIDIPLGIVYNVTKNFYASAGVSYFNVINEKRNNTYITGSQFLQTDSDPLTGESSSYQAVKSEAVEETSNESTLKGNSYLGFFNFSVGRQQHLFDRYNILIEPFVKIPVGKLSDQEFKLMNSGVKFKISF